VKESLKQDDMEGITDTPTTKHWVPGISDVDFEAPCMPGEIIENVGHIDSRSMYHCCCKTAYSKESNVAKRERMAAHTDPEKGKKKKKR
jgi:hypothetical protein